MKNLISMIANLAIEISTTTEHDVFFYVSGHVKSVSCSVIIGGYQNLPASTIQQQHFDDAKFDDEAGLIKIVGELSTILDGTSPLVEKPDPVYRAMQDAMQHSQH